jgi:hypothetical protein
MVGESVLHAGLQSIGCKSQRQSIEFGSTLHGFRQRVGVALHLHSSDVGSLKQVHTGSFGVVWQVHIVEFASTVHGSTQTSIVGSAAQMQALLVGSILHASVSQIALVASVEHKHAID